MKHPTRTGRPTPRRTGLSLLFALTALSGIALAFAAWALPRAGARAAERALYAYAAYFTASVLNNAEWDIRRALNDRLYVPSRQALLSGVESRLPSEADWDAAARTADACRCVPPIAEGFQFRFDEATGSLETSGVAPPSEFVAAWLADTLRAAPQVHEAAPAFLVGQPLGAIVLFPGTRAPGIGIAARFVRAGPGGTRVAYGYAADVRPWLRLAIPDMLERTPLFPESERAPNAALVSLTLWSAAGAAGAAGTPIYAGAALPGDRAADAAADTLVFVRPEFGGVRASLAAGPDALRLLRPRLGGGMLIPALALVFVSLLATTALAARIVRREAALARARTDFVTSVSHELQTPLAQILLFADMLRLDRLRSAADRSRALDVIVHETERLAHLVANVLHVARAERGGGAMGRIPMQLAPLVEEIVERFLPLVDEADVSIELQLEDDVVVAIDRGPVTQILLNLLDNAVKHGRASQVVRVGLAGDGDGARLWVEDQGPGIAPRFREKIWDPFVRLPRVPGPGDLSADAGAAGHGAPGTGIGLAVVRDLALSHGGSVAIEDAPGGGARFVIRLPICTITMAGRRS